MRASIDYRARSVSQIVKFLAGFIAAFVVVALAATVVILSGVYDVAATVPHTALEELILSSTMRYSVEAHAGNESRETWSEEQVREGFKQYDEMCIICHAAPGKERTDISKGLRPNPPKLAEWAKRWNNAELFWIIKNGVKMTGMPAFGPTHRDELIWDVVGFVRRLPNLSAEEFATMEKQFGKSAGLEQGQHQEQGHHHE